MFKSILIFSDFRKELKEDINKFEYILEILEQKSEIVATKLTASDEIRKKILALQRNCDFMPGMNCHFVVL